MKKFLATFLAAMLLMTMCFASTSVSASSINTGFTTGLDTWIVDAVAGSDVIIAHDATEGAVKFTAAGDTGLGTWSGTCLKNSSDITSGFSVETNEYVVVSFNIKITEISGTSGALFFPATRSVAKSWGSFMPQFNANGTFGGDATAVQTYDTNVWYKYESVINCTTGVTETTLTDLATNAKKAVFDSTWNTDMGGINGFELHMGARGTFFIKNFSVAAKHVNAAITSPAAESKVDAANDMVVTGTLPYGYSSAALTLDGETIGSFTSEDEFSVTVPKASLTYGRHFLELTAACGDETKKASSAIAVTGIKNNLYFEGIANVVESVKATNSGSTASVIIDAQATSDNHFTIAQSENGIIATHDATAVKGTLRTLFKNPMVANSGVFYAEMTLLPSNTVTVESLISKADNASGADYIGGWFSPTLNANTSYKYTFIVDSNNGKYSIMCNGTTVSDQPGISFENGFMSVLFDCNMTGSGDTLTISDIKAYTFGEAPYISSIGYTKDSVFNNTDAEISALSESVTIGFSDVVADENINSDNIVLKKSNNTVVNTTVSRAADGKTLIISAPEGGFEANTEYTVELGNGIICGASAMGGTVCYFKTNGDALDAIAQPVAAIDGNTASASFKVSKAATNSVLPESAQIILAVYDGNVLTAVNLKAMTLTAGVNTDSLTISNINDGTSVKAFVWDTDNRPLYPER